MNLSKLRNWSFWIADALSGGSIKKHLADITSVLDNPQDENSLKKQETNLNYLLEHATRTTTFYSKFNNYNSIKDFPVIKKSDVQGSFNEFKSSKYTKNLYKVATSGSTGTPFFLFHNKNKRKRNIADVYYFLNVANHTLGERLYELEVWRNHNRKSLLKSWIQNVHQFDISKLTDQKIYDFLNSINNYKYSKTFLGFASSLETICQYLDTKKYPNECPEVKTIIANSEFLNTYTKQSLTHHFKANVYSRYSNEEMGIIAHQIASSKEHFKINWASYYVELLDMNTDEPAKLGHLGRIVITDLYNYSMPLIRFDTGDVGRFTKSSSKRPNFEHIEGRKMDMIYDTQGNIISSFIIYTKFYKYYKKLRQYQFVQNGKKEYTINLNIIDDFDSEKELIEDIKLDFGQDAIVQINYVNEIPPLASGKRKKVVNLYHEQPNN